MHFNTRPYLKGKGIWSLSGSNTLPFIIMFIVLIIVTLRMVTERLPPHYPRHQLINFIDTVTFQFYKSFKKLYNNLSNHNPEIAYVH
ncbi:hypothetical protein GGD38_004336 [Chitinophagaceae bacterium OAS944]|nr:hypothetical protein [Chitinophagaceae bacterium OAS944]